MTVNVGVIGAGIMGGDHGRILASSVARCKLVAICDADEARAAAVASATGAERHGTDPYALIADPGIDAIVIASPDATHADYTLACLAAGKPVLCEKPLAPTSAQCLSVMEAEMKLGRRLLQVGFMRRFDPGYQAMAHALSSGEIGEALAMHCIHRNVSVPPTFTSAMSINSSCGHEIDVARYVLGADITRIQVFKPKKATRALSHDPLFVVMETDQGQIVDVELFLNCGYGYEVRAELVAENAIMALTNPDVTERRADLSVQRSLPADWRPRFAEAYRRQNQAFIDWIGGAQAQGATAWDGFVTALVAEAGVKALESGQPVDITLPEKPAFYR